MKSILIVIGLLLLSTMESQAQSQSNHYKSKARGHFTHGSQVSGKTAKNRSINIWTEGHLQSSTYAQNKTSIGQARDTTPSSVSALVKNASHLVYPNPFVESLSVTTTNGSTIDDITIYDLAGRLVYSKSNCGFSCEIDLGSLSSGGYYIRISSGEDFIVQKLLKN